MNGKQTASYLNAQIKPAPAKAPTTPVVKPAPTKAPKAPVVKPAPAKAPMTPVVKPAITKNQITLPDKVPTIKPTSIKTVTKLAKIKKLLTEKVINIWKS